MVRQPGVGMVARAAGVFAAVAIGVGASVWLTEPTNLPIRQVHLHGMIQHQDPARLEEVIAEVLTGNMLTQDLEGLEQRLQQYPWVRQARIQRDWPATLRIEVIEQIPVARWEAGGLLSEKGERFTLQGEPEPDLVQVLGMPGRERALAGYLIRMNELLWPSGMRLARLEETEFRSLHLTMQSGLRLTLGRIRPLERLARWLRYYEAYARTAPTHPTIIDLRYPNGFAVRSPTES